MNRSPNILIKKKEFLPVIALVTYALGAIFLFVSPTSVFLSPGLTLPTAGITSPLFFSMLLLAATSIVFVMTIYKKEKEIKTQKISKETGEFIAKNIENEVNQITESVLAREYQTKKDFNKFVYVVGILSIALALIQAWNIYSVGTAAGVSLIYWGAYLAIAAGWFGYGIYYKDRSIMFTYGVCLILEIIIINGTIFYG